MKNAVTAPALPVNVAPGIPSRLLGWRTSLALFALLFANTTLFFYYVIHSGWFDLRLLAH